MSIELQRRLSNLNEVVSALTRSTTLDELFQCAIELGLEKLGFDRLRIAMLGAEPDRLEGIYGTDKHGNVQDERGTSIFLTDHQSPLRYLCMGDRRKAILLGPEIGNCNADVIACEWSAVAAIWNDDTTVGFLFADNFISARPYTEDDEQLLSMYASSLGHLYTHLQLAQTLQKRRLGANAFFNKMASLNKVAILLTRCNNLDELCYSAIELGCQKLGFDRLGLWFIGEEPDILTGTYGTDEVGNIRCEYGQTLRFGHESLFGRRLQKGERYICDTGIIIPDINGNPIGYGWKAAAALWDGEQIVGYLFTDNLLQHAPYSVNDGELLALYARLLGHFCSRQRVEESLRKRENTYRTLIDAIPDYTVVVSRTGTVLNYHEAQPPTLPFILPDVVGKSVQDLFETKLSNQCLAAIEEAFTRNHVISFEYQLTSQELTYYLEIRVTAGHDNQGILLIRDITDRKILEEQLHASQKMESLGRMAGGIAHDFNNFLTVIQGFSGLALSMVNESSPRLYSALQRIETASAKAAQLTNQLLLFARKQVVKPQLLEVNDVIGEIETLLVPLIGEEIELIISLNPRGGYIYMDPGQLEQVILNLAVNARDAMEASGTLTIATQNVVVSPEEAHRWMQIAAGGYVMIEVSDTGCGIEESMRQQIFEPFFTTKEKGKGTGLGLSICHSIVQQNGGSLQVESVLGEGTTFKILLPEKHFDSTATNAVNQVGPSSGVGTILLVEDDEPVREVVGEVLEMHGYTVLACSNGHIALDIARTSNDINLLITDMAMPQMGGREVAEQFLEIYPKAPVLLVSGYVEELPESLVSRPNVRFLPKPYTAVALTEAVHKSIKAQP